MTTSLLRLSSRVHGGEPDQERKNRDTNRLDGKVRKGGEGLIDKLSIFRRASFLRPWLRPADRCSRRRMQ